MEAYQVSRNGIAAFVARLTSGFQWNVLAAATKVLSMTADFSCECGHSLDERGLVKALDETVVTKDDYFENPYPANCGECESWLTVVSRNDRNLCVVCLDVTDELDTCGFCSAATTCTLEDSYLFGCGQCDGSAGWNADKDD